MSGVSKIECGSQTIIDLTNDSVEPSKMLFGTTAHDKTGEVVVGTIETVAQATPVITVSSSGLITASATQEAGYVSAGTVSAEKQLTVQGAQTITPNTSNQTISSGRYLTGAQTIKGDSNLKAANIKSGVSIFGVSGSYTGNTTLYAAIGVTYPAGSTCTCTKGSTVYTASDTTGTCVFNITSTGTYTIKCTNGTSTSSTSVSITAQGQFKSVTLQYEWIIYNGTATAEYTGGWTSNFTVSDVLSIKNLSTSTTYDFCTNGSSAKAISLTDFSSLVITVKSIANKGYVKFFVDDASQNGNGIYNDISSSIISSVDLKTGTNTLDVSKLSGSYYIGVALKSNAGSTVSSVEISKIVGV